MNATELARSLSLSKGRISQLVADGTLDGCWTGEGRRRRFDLRLAAAQLGKVLDPGQRLGNGAASEAARRAILDEAVPADPPPADPVQRDGTQLPGGDDDRYRLARTQKAEEEARRLRRQNAEDEGRYVLAAAAAREARRLLAAEVSGFEQVIREGARAVADEMGIDMKQVRAVLRRVWRAHRTARADTLDAAAGQARLSGDEAAEQI